MSGPTHQPQVKSSRMERDRVRGPQPCAISDSLMRNNAWDFLDPAAQRLACYIEQQPRAGDADDPVWLVNRELLRKVMGLSPSALTRAMLSLCRAWAICFVPCAHDDSRYLVYAPAGLTDAMAESIARLASPTSALTAKFEEVAA